jgi:thioredoxin 1
MLAQYCRNAPANIVILLTVAVSMWCIFVWVPSVWKSKGGNMSKTLKIAVVAALVLAVAAIVAVKQRDKGRNAGQRVATPEVAATPAAAGLPRLIDLGSVTCIPCKMMAPILEELKKEYAGRLSVEFYDVVQNPAVAKQYNMKLMPTQIFFDASGKERFRHEGFLGKDDILAKWKELGVSL